MSQEEYITRAEADRLIKEEVRRQLQEQKTDEMKPINVNLASQDVINRLDGIQQYFEKELKTVSDTWLSTLQEHYTEHKEDLKAMEERIINAIRNISSPGKN
jgi:predicted NAD-dependent protein-ADP-ribosyltransferase YbiA (DUF1768 family)